MFTRAAIVMCCLLAGATVIGRASDAEPTLLRSPLEGLPLDLGNWQGAEAARFDERTLQVLGADEYLHRAYQTAEKRPVWLFIGFYASQRQGDTMHSPLNCLPGAGWQPLERSSLTIPVAARPGAEPREITVNEFLIGRGEDRQVVLYWYQSHGRVEANEYKSKVWTVFDAVRLNRTDGAIVRVTSPVSGDARMARQGAVEFVQSLFPHLHQHLPE